MYSIITLLVMSYCFGLIPPYGDGVGYHFLYRQLRIGNWSLMSPLNPPPAEGEYMYAPAREEWSTYYQIGAPIVWALAAPMTSVAQSLIGQFVTQHPEAPYSAPFLADGLIILTVTLLLAIGILLLTVRIVMHTSGASPRLAWIAAAAAFFGLPTWYYFIYGAATSHIVELFVLTAALSVWWIAHQRISYPLLALSSALIGYAALVRIDALLFLLPLGIASIRRFPCLRRTVLALLPAVFVCAIQMLIWLHLFGTFLPPHTYTLNRFVLPARYGYEILFSGTRGLFAWSPVAAIGVIGLIGALKMAKYHFIALIGISTLLLYIFFYGSWEMWWGGLLFGQRFLIPLYPFIAVGIALFLQSAMALPRGLRLGVYGFLGIIIGYAMTLTLVYPFVGRTFHNMEFQTPWQIFSLARTEYGFFNRTAFTSMFQTMFWHGPRFIHLFTP